MLIKKISDLLAKDKVQRLCYLLALILWVMINWRTQEYYNSISSLGIQYKWILILPASLLILHIAFNRIITWALILTLIMSYTILCIYLLIEYSLDTLTYWNLKEAVTSLIFFVLLFVVNWIVWKLKPAKKTNK